ncbi:hypothetical protein TRICI_001404 [Trichomonascus ciferrii]|uniref:HhH-GPD domain-containing protein n=1 Tax=Trichomonascus ciferrii TaxID=44093 RepID=A0A642V9P2_9ASCO|nr:hypothetical protein TRICI_001404 [Trichomonascus ciferrii]
MQLRSRVKRTVEDAGDMALPPHPHTPKKKVKPSVAVKGPEPLSDEELVGALQDREQYDQEFVKGIDHVLRIDPSLKDIISQSTFPHFKKAAEDADFRSGCFMALARGIIGQQVSGAAAKSILKRFIRIYHPDAPEDSGGLDFPSPQQVLDTSTDDLRSAGLSGRKTEYIKVLAEAFKNGTLSEEWLFKASDDDVVDALVDLKGIGPWSADMFLLFTLRRMDVFSVGDLGVQRGVANYIKQRPWVDQELKSVDWSVPMDGLHSPGKSAKAKARKPAKTPSQSKNGSSKWKVPEQKHMEYIANKFRPYRTVFQMVTWKLSSVDIAVLEDKKSTTDKYDYY